MAAYASKLIQSNTEDSDQRSSGWVIAIVRYLEPSTMADSNGFPSKVLVIQNDATSVSVSNPKSNFGKTCSINLKCTDVWYPSSVSPGDWVFVWMHKTQKELDRVTANVNKIQNGGSVGNALCDQNSGLKFAGRIINISHNDSVSTSGVRAINQTIQAQAFLEFATSVYYTARATSFLKDVANPTATLVEGIQDKGLDDVLGRLARKYREVYVKEDGIPTPDEIIALYFIIIMGIDRDKFNETIGANGIFNNGIHVPDSVARIFNKPKAKKLWQIMNVYLGIQKHSDQTPWYKGFSPSVQETEEEVFKRTPVRCKGFVPYQPSLWENINVWTILNNYLNPVCNEMYTALRINEQGKIIPTLTVREKPFSTGLFDAIATNTFGPGGAATKAKGIETKPEADPWEQANQRNENEAQSTGRLVKDAINTLSNKLNKNTLASQAFSASVKKSSTTRTLYGSLPRWQISESIVKSFSFNSSEANRINFVQVWGRSATLDFLGIKGLSAAQLQGFQFNNGNFFVDRKDITRNGLRAYIAQSNYDVSWGESAQFFAPLWAQMSADWLFNGHLKVNGTLTTTGIVEPICEGDNLEYRGILFHIESVSHQAQLSATGQKIWTTSISLSNGIMAKSVNDPNGVPSYVTYQGKSGNGLVRREGYTQPIAPGSTEAQTRLGDESKNTLGDAINKIIGKKGIY